MTHLETNLLNLLADKLNPAEPDYSDICLHDISDDLIRDRGVLASLVKKGLVEVEEWKEWQLIYLTEAGWEVLQ